MEKNEPIDLRGKICPFPVFEIINQVNFLHQDQRVSFLVDDPLAIKSVPEELEEFSNLMVDIVPENNSWIITIHKNS